MDSQQLYFGLKLFSALGCGLTAGVFFTFSSFVMPALSRLRTTQAIATMQAINLAIFNPLAIVLFAATGFACSLLLLITGFNWQQPGANALFAGSFTYLCGVVLVTISAHTRLNNLLAAANPISENNRVLWVYFRDSWGFWNWVRAIAALVAAVLLTSAFYVT